MNWEQEDGDKWYQRNKKKLTTTGDQILKIIKKNNLRPKEVLEVGCANGYRLRKLKQLYGCRLMGVDLSYDAAEYGRSKYHVPIWCGPFEKSTFLGLHDLVILNYVLEYVDRDKLLYFLHRVNQNLVEGGHLIIGEFIPTTESFCKTREKHSKDQKYVYKNYYPEILTHTGLYELVDELYYNHKTKKIGDLKDEMKDMVYVTLLKKVDRYKLVKL